MPWTAHWGDQRLAHVERRDRIAHDMRRTFLLCPFVDPPRNGSGVSSPMGQIITRERTFSRRADRTRRAAALAFCLPAEPPNRVRPPIGICTLCAILPPLRADSCPPRAAGDAVPCGAFNGGGVYCFGSFTSDVDSLPTWVFCGAVPVFGVGLRYTLGSCFGSGAVFVEIKIAG